MESENWSDVVLVLGMALLLYLPGIIRAWKGKDDDE